MYQFLAIFLTAIALSACTAAPEITLPPLQERDMELSMPSSTEELDPTEVAAAVNLKETLTIYRFDSPETAGRWAIVNDSVMGGVSESSLALREDGAVIFTGNLSTDNNGGFASIRSVPDTLGITDETGIRLTVRGDGQVYHLRLYTPDSRGVAYEAGFQTVENEWQTIDLPFSTFKPTYFGRVLTDYTPLAPDMIEALGIMIKEYQVGPFALEVATIEAYH